LAAYFGKIECLKILLDCGADLLLRE